MRKYIRTPSKKALLHAFSHCRFSSESLVITCDEVRHCPDLRRLQAGTVFIARTPGNTVDPDTDNSGLARSLANLLSRESNLRRIIVRAHTHCSYMPALANESVSPVDHPWTRHCRKTISTHLLRYRDLPAEQSHAFCLHHNVIEQLENLRRIPAVAGALSKGNLQLIGWIYDAEFDWISLHDPETDMFLPPNCHYFKFDDQPNSKIFFE